MSRVPRLQHTTEVKYLPLLPQSTWNCTGCCLTSILASTALLPKACTLTKLIASNSSSLSILWTGTFLHFLEKWFFLPIAYTSSPSRALHPIKFTVVATTFAGNFLCWPPVRRLSSKRLSIWHDLIYVIHRPRYNVSSATQQLPLGHTSMQRFRLTEVSFSATSWSYVRYKFQAQYDHGLNLANNNKLNGMFSPDS